MTTILTGANGFLLQRELARRVAEFVDEHGDLAMERLDGEDNSFDEIRAALTSLPFLANKKLVLLRAPGANKQFSEQAEKILPEVADTTEVIIVEPKLDKRSSYYKFLKKSTDFHEFNALDAMGLARWLVETAKAGKGSLSLADANFLVERVGANQKILASELEKLLLYDPKVTRANIELLTEPSPQSTIFQLIEAAFAGDSKRALELYEEQRVLKVEPQHIIAMLAWQLHILALIKVAGDRSPDTIAREAKISPYVARKSSSVARRLSLAQLKTMISDLLKIDQRLKRENIDADEALKHYLLKINL